MFKELDLILKKIISQWKNEGIGIDSSLREELLNFSYKTGRENSRKVLIDFPEFPKDIDFELDESIKDQSLFNVFCNWQLNSIFKDKIEIACEDTDCFQIFEEEHIWDIVNKGLILGYDEVWKDHFGKEVSREILHLKP